MSMDMDNGKKGIYGATAARDRTIARAKKQQSKNENPSYAQDFANYGSFDESYFEGADAMYKPSQTYQKGKQSERKKGAQTVLEILAEERKARRAANYDNNQQYDGEGDEDEFYEDDEDDDVDDEKEDEEVIVRRDESQRKKAPAIKAVVQEVSKPKPNKPNKPEAVAAAKPKSVLPPARTKPVAAAVAAAPAKKQKDDTPEEAKAKAKKTLEKWGFRTEDIEVALKNASEGDTAKQMQISVLDYLLESAPIENIPIEYLPDAKKKRM